MDYNHVLGLEPHGRQHDGVWCGNRTLDARKRLRGMMRVLAAEVAASGAPICVFTVSDVCSFPAVTAHGKPKSNLTNFGRASEVWHL